MEKDRIELYQPYVRRIDEPIREIVQGIWGLPFVLDTGFSCSGHLLSPYHQSTGGRIGNEGFRLHRAMLEIAFSAERPFAARDAFRKNLSEVEHTGTVKGLDILLRFDEIRSWERNCLPYSNIPGLNLQENFKLMAIEALPEDPDLVEPVEDLLSCFWEKVAAVVRVYNPAAEIGPIHGKNFRKANEGINFSTIDRNRRKNKDSFF